jgi:putative NADH-flavin reductase
MVSATAKKRPPSKLLVLGATGGIGVEIVRQAVGVGHDVTAFVRTPDALQAFANRIRIVQGDLLDRAQLARVVGEHDAILSAFGPRLPLARSDSDLLRRFAAALTNAMSDTASRRLIIVSVAFLFRNAVLPPAYLIGRLFFPSVVTDAAGMEGRVTRSNCDWTVVRPPELTDKPLSGQYRVREGRLPAFGFKVSRADVAHFMLSAASDSSTAQKIYGLAR